MPPLEKRSMELRVGQAALEGLFEILERNNVPLWSS